MREVASLDCSVNMLSTRAQNRCACTATRDIENKLVALQATIPDASSIAGGLALSIAMLSLEITRGHVRVRLDRFRRKFFTLLKIVFVDDLQRESVEDRLFEIFIDVCR